MLERIRRILVTLGDGLIRLQRGLVALAAIMLTGLVFVQVVTRYVFSYSIFGIEELATFVAVWFYFLGAAIAAQEGMHISASLVDVVIHSQRARQWLRIVTDALATFICGWMAWWAIGLTAWTLDRGMMSLELDFPMGYVYLAMPVGLVLVCAYLLGDLWRSVRVLRGAGNEAA